MMQKLIFLVFQEACYDQYEIFVYLVSLLPVGSHFFVRFNNDFIRYTKKLFLKNFFCSMFQWTNFDMKISLNFSTFRTSGMIVFFVSSFYMRKVTEWVQISAIGNISGRNWFPKIIKNPFLTILFSRCTQILLNRISYKLRI